MKALYSSLRTLPILFLLLTCGGDQEQKTQVRILLPAQAPQDIRYLSGASEKNPLHRQRNFGGSLPSNKDEINCYGIMVGWDDPSRPRSQCTSLDNKVIARPLRVEGTFPAGGELMINVESGPARTFDVLAFKKSGDQFCPPLFPLPPEVKDTLSPPILIGSTTIDLAPGSQEVTVNVGLGDAQIVGNCEGPAFEFDPHDPSQGTQGFPITPGGGFHDFGNLTSSPSAFSRFYFENPTDFELHGCSQPVIVGRDPTIFRVAATNCTDIQGPKQRCYVDLQARPVNNGTYFASFERRCNEGGWLSGVDSLKVSLGNTSGTFQRVSGGFIAEGGHSLIAIDGFGIDANYKVEVGTTPCPVIAYGDDFIDCLSPKGLTLGTTHSIIVKDGSNAIVATLSGVGGDVRVVPDVWGDGADLNFSYTGTPTTITVNSATITLDDNQTPSDFTDDYKKYVSFAATVKELSWDSSSSYTHSAGVNIDVTGNGFTSLRLGTDIVNPHPASPPFPTSQIEAGDEVILHVTVEKGTGCGAQNAGSFLNARVIDVNYGTDTIVIDEAYDAASGSVTNAMLESAYGNSNVCRIQVVRVPNFQIVSSSAALTLEPIAYDPTQGFGGILAMRSGGSFDGTNITLNVSGMGYPGGTTARTPGGSQQGINSNATEFNFWSGGGSYKTGTPIAGAAGGGAQGAGGEIVTGGKGDSYGINCDIPKDDKCILFGGGGGGGDAHAGGKGGGIVVLQGARVTQLPTIVADGEDSADCLNPSCTYQAGAGAGGTIWVGAGRIASGANATQLFARGGSAGNTNSGAKRGGAGGGGLLVMDRCKAGSLPGSFTGPLSLPGTIGDLAKGGSSTTGTGTGADTAAGNGVVSPNEPTSNGYPCLQ